MIILYSQITKITIKKFGRKFKLQFFVGLIKHFDETWESLDLDDLKSKFKNAEIVNI